MKCYYSHLVVYCGCGLWIRTGLELFLAFDWTCVFFCVSFLCRSWLLDAVASRARFLNASFSLSKAGSMAYRYCALNRIDRGRGFYKPPSDLYQTYKKLQCKERSAIVNDVQYAHSVHYTSPPNTNFSTTGSLSITHQSTASTLGINFLCAVTCNRVE